MIKFKDLLEVATSDIVIREGTDNVLSINVWRCNASALSDKLLNAEINAVYTDRKNIIVRLAEGLGND